MIRAKQRIVLYNPQQKEKGRGRPYAKDCLPLSLLTIAGWPVRDGYDVVIIDGELYPQEEAHQRVLEACEGAFLYGTTGILGYQVADGFLCSSKVKQRFGDLPMLIGGWFASVAPELQLATGLYDAVVLGQGELTFREVVRALDCGEPLDRIAGLALLRDGQVVRTDVRHPVGWSELTDNPWHLIDFEPYREQQLALRHVTAVESAIPPPDAHSPRRKRPHVATAYYSSYGCPLQCTFCCSPEVSGLRWKAMPAERMLDDIAGLQERWGFDVVRFFDANYGVMEKRVRAFAEGVLERGLKLWQYGYMQAPSVVRFQDATVEAMAASGFYQILIGGEAGTDETMKAIKKTTRGDENLQAAVRLAQRGIRPQLTYVIGYPRESAESMLATIDQCRRVQVACPDSHPEVWPFRPIPGTPAFREAVELGYEPPRDLLEWGHIGDYRLHETWHGKIPPHVARARRTLIHYSSLAKGRARGRIGWWERRAQKRMQRGDFRLARIEAKAFDIYRRLGLKLSS